eukprot:14782950-Ditylum_brightwellii.AAC.1
MLKQPLGKWFYSYKKWNAYYNSKEDCTVVYTSRWTKHKIEKRTRQHLTISVEGTKTDQPEREAEHMLPITDLMPKGDSLQFTQPATYKTRQNAENLTLSRNTSKIFLRGRGSYFYIRNTLQTMKS